MGEQYQSIRNQALLTLSDPGAHLLNRFDVGNLTQINPFQLALAHARPLGAEPIQ
ncbi:hypothetical protein ACWCXX_40360 [Streptomyces sp. NPDC001732]